MKIDVPELPEGMKSYVVTWVAGFVASNHKNAARQARAMWDNPDNEVVGFQVQDFDGVSTQVLTLPTDNATPTEHVKVLQRCVETLEENRPDIARVESAVYMRDYYDAAIEAARSLLDGKKL